MSAPKNLHCSDQIDINAAREPCMNNCACSKHLMEHDKTIANSFICQKAPWN